MFVLKHYQHSLFLQLAVSALCERATISAMLCVYNARLLGFLRNKFVLSFITAFFNTVFSLGDCLLIQKQKCVWKATNVDSLRHRECNNVRQKFPYYQYLTLWACYQAVTSSNPFKDPRPRNRFLVMNILWNTADSILFLVPFQFQESIPPPPKKNRPKIPALRQRSKTKKEIL
jgi:hypothetical protein